jgi:hypothetical protein
MPNSGVDISFKGLSLDVDAPSSQGWSQSENDPLTRWLQASLSPTGDANIFSLNGIPPNFDFDGLEGELQLSLGMQDPMFMTPNPMPQISSFGQDAFSQFDMSSQAMPSSQSVTSNTNAGPSRALSPVQHSSDMPFFSPHDSLPPSTSLSHEQRVYSLGGDMMQFLNLEPPSNTSPPRTGSLQNTLPFPMPLQESNVDTAAGAQTPYQPPAGANNSGTRRVGASWKRAIISGAESPIDRSPPRESWGVSAS